MSVFLPKHGTIKGLPSKDQRINHKDGLKLVAFKVEFSTIAYAFKGPKRPLFSLKFTLCQSLFVVTTFTFLASIITFMLHWSRETDTYRL